MVRKFTKPELDELAIAFGLTANFGQITSATEVCFQKAWVVWSTTDEGRRRDRIGVFSTPDKAAVAAKGRGSWGTEGEIDEAFVMFFVGDSERTYLIDGPAPLFMDRDLPKYEREVRDAALAKLTPLEKNVLGLTG